MMLEICSAGTRHFYNRPRFVRSEKRRIDNSVFNANIVQHVENYDSSMSFIIKKKDATFAIISDIHWPWVNKKVIAAFYAFIEEYQPDFIIINGDAWDISHSKYPQSQIFTRPREEQALARKMNEEFWTKVHKLCPKAKCFQLLGNHDIRPLKRTLESYPEAEDWIDEKMKAFAVFSFPNVTTFHDHRQELQINDDLIFPWIPL